MVFILFLFLSKILFLFQTDTGAGTNMEHEAFKTEYQQMKKEKEKLEKVPNKPFTAIHSSSSIEQFLS